MLGGRAPSMVAKEALNPRNYAAVARMARVVPDFRQGLGRYFLGRGSYPWDCRLRTPVGMVAPTLYSHHDMWTVNEIFCRRDYGDDRSARVVVDVGSNIGISALFFLTRNADCRCWLFEPVPANAERLRRNLAPWEARWTLREAAVAAAGGTVSFGVEDTGRYGGIGVATERSIEVECVPIADVLAAVLEENETIDVLKIDTEGTELELLRAVDPALLARVRAVYLEVETDPGLALPGFEAAFNNQTLVLRNRR